MSILSRLLGSEPVSTVAPDVILATDQRIRCMACDSDRPLLTLTELHDYARRDGVKLIEQVSGRRVECQDCGDIFSIGPHGQWHETSSIGATRRRQPATFPPGESIGAQGPPEPPATGGLRPPLERSRV